MTNFEQEIVRGKNPKLQLVAHRGILPGAVLQGGGANNYTLGETLMLCKVGRKRVSDVRLAFAGFYVQSGANGEAVNPYDIIVRGAFQQTTPSIAPRTPFNGSFDITIKKGVSHIITDPLGLNFAAGESIKVQMSTYVNSTETWPASQLSQSESVQYVSTLADSSSQVGTTSAWSGTSRASNYTAGPVAILGVPEEPFPSVAVLGDSIADGSGESGAGDGFGNYGWVCRGLYNVGVDNDAIPYTRLTMAGDAALTYYNGGGYRRLALLQYASDVINQLGSNDVVGQDLAACKERLTFIWTAARARGKRVFQCLVMPRTTGAYHSAATQKPVAGFERGGVRDQLNDWIRSQVGKGLLDDIIDPNPYVQDPDYPDRWRSSEGALTADGVHCNTPGHLAASQASRKYAGTYGLSF